MDVLRGQPELHMGRVPRQMGKVNMRKEDHSDWKRRHLTNRALTGLIGVSRTTYFVWLSR